MSTGWYKCVSCAHNNALCVGTYVQTLVQHFTSCHYSPLHLQSRTSLRSFNVVPVLQCGCFLQAFICLVRDLLHLSKGMRSMTTDLESLHKWFWSRFSIYAGVKMGLAVDAVIIGCQG